VNNFKTATALNSDENEMSSDASTQQRWILVLSIALFLLGATVLTLRSSLLSLALTIAGVALFTYWLYGVVRSRELNRYLSEGDTISSKLGTEVRTSCSCSVCKHTESKACKRIRCVCCVLVRNKQIIGHFNKPSQ
jgi:hypothetical protein